MSKSVSDLHRDLDWNPDNGESHSMQINNDDRAVDPVSQSQGQFIHDAVYRALPTSTISPRGTRLSIENNDGRIGVLELQRVDDYEKSTRKGGQLGQTIPSKSTFIHASGVGSRRASQQLDYADSPQRRASVQSVQSRASTALYTSPTRRSSLRSSAQNIQASPNRASLFGNHSAAPNAQANLSDFPLLERIPIIGKQSYNGTIKELRNRINGLQNLSLKLHGGAHEKLFDSLQNKVVKLSQSARVHQHELDGMRTEIEYLLNEIITQQNMREELYGKVDTLEESKRELLGSIRELNGKIRERNGDILEWKEKMKNKNQIVKLKEDKVESLNKQLAYQSAEIAHGQKMTEKNLQRLQAHIKRVSSELKTEKEIGDGLRFKLNGANLKNHQFEDDIKGLDDKVTFFREFKEKSERLQDEVASLQMEVSSTKERLYKTEDALESEKNKSSGLNLEKLEMNSEINRLESSEQSLQENLSAITKELDNRMMELKDLNELKDAEVRIKEKYKTDLESERKERMSMEEEHRNFAGSMKEKLNMMETEVTTKEMTIDDLRDQMAAQQSMYEDKLENKGKEHREQVAAIKGEYIAQCNQYESRVIAMSKSNGELQSGMNRIKKDYSKLSNIWENDQQTIKSLSQQIEHSRTRIEKLISEGHRKGLQNDEQKLDLRNLKSELSQMNKMMENKDQLVQNQNAELSDLRKRINELLDLLDAKDSTVSEYAQQIKRLSAVQERLESLTKDHEEVQTQNSRLVAALQSEKGVNRKMDEKLKSTSKSFGEMIQKDQEELNKLNKLLKETQRDSTKKSKKIERLSTSLEDVKRNGAEERELLQDTVERLRKDVSNLKKTHDSSKEMWAKRVRKLSVQSERDQDTIEQREKEMMKHAIEMAKLKSQIAITAQSSYVSRNPSIEKSTDNAKSYLVDQLNQQKNEIKNLYTLLNSESRRNNSSHRHHFGVRNNDLGDSSLVDSSREGSAYATSASMDREQRRQIIP